MAIHKYVIKVVPYHNVAATLYNIRYASSFAPFLCCHKFSVITLVRETAWSGQVAGVEPRPYDIGDGQRPIAARAGL